jgi:hypothetical protein
MPRTSLAKQILPRLAAYRTDDKNTYVELTREQFERSRCTSYTGGCSWLRSPDFPSGHLVLSCTPIEIRQHFTNKPHLAVRAQFVAEVQS